MRVTKAVVPAAGMGVRFLPATKALPKEMIPVIDTPAIQYIVEEALDSGVGDILIVTGRGKRAMEDYFDRSPALESFLEAKKKKDLLAVVRKIGNLADIHYVRQKEQLGLGHAVLSARRFVAGEPFAVLLGDDLVRSKTPCLKQLLDLYEEMPGAVLAVAEVPPEDVGKYGILDAEPLREGVYRVKGLVEKPAPGKAPSRLAVIGRYILTPGIFPILAETPPGAGGEIQLTDALNVLCRHEPVYGLAFKGRRYDVGDKLGYLKATVEFALDRPDLGPAFEAYLKELVGGLS